MTYLQWFLVVLSSMQGLDPVPMHESLCPEVTMRLKKILQEEHTDLAP